MKKILLLIFVLSINEIFAQPSQLQRIQDSVIGWYSTQNINEVPKPYKYLNRTFSTKQQQNMMNVIEWMKKSYIPVAGLGTFQRMVYADSYSNPPHSYGVDFRIWNVSFMKEYLDTKGHFKPVPEEYNRFGVTANLFIGSYGINYMNGPDQYVFAWQPDGYEKYLIPKMDKADPKIHRNVYKYITRITNVTMTVYLAPDNKLPIIPLTRGEYLQLAYEAMNQLPERNKQRIAETYLMKTPEGDRQRKEAMDEVIKQAARYKQYIDQLREKYKNNLNEPAIVNHMQPNERDFSGNDDPFEIGIQQKNSGTMYQIYKIDKATLDKCKSDQTQWLAIWFPYETKEDGNQLYELSRAMREHFNYDYAYNYFFNPERVKGVVYKPINEELLNVTLDKYRKKEYWKNANETKSLPANVHFADDFSNNTEGSKPAGWFFSSYGKHCMVTAIAEQTGKWVKLGYANEFSPTSLKKPLPQNFTLEYDMATDDFNVRYGGSGFLYLSTWSANADGRENRTGNGVSIRLEINSGNEADYYNNNYSGLAKISLSRTPEINKDNYGGGASFSYELREFTNKKNKVHVALQVNNGAITVFINNKKIIGPTDMKLPMGGNCIDCTIPANVRFNTIYWRNTTNDVDKTGLYISNVKITKD